MSNPESIPPRTMPGLLASQFRYLFDRKPWPIELPTVVQFPVNDICDSKCQMCNIWQQRKYHEISPNEIRRLFGSVLFRRVRTIGINGGEPTLRRDLADIGCALMETLPSVRQISIITNGLHADRAIARIEELVSATCARGVGLDIMVSLDGVGELHDRVRGAAGNFDAAIRVLRHFHGRRDVRSVRVGCTIIRENAYGLHDLHDFCQDLGVYVKYRLGVRNRRLYNLDSSGPKQIGKRTWLDTGPFELDPARRWHVAQFLLGLADEYEPSLSQEQFYRSLVGQLIHGSPRRAGCDWAHRGVTVSSRGEIMYCAVQSRALGNGLTADPLSLYLGNAAHLESIVRDKCSGCAHDYVGPPGGKWQALLILDRLLGRIGSGAKRARRSSVGRATMTLKRRIMDPVRFSRRRRRALAIAGSDMAAPDPSQDVIICGWYGTETLGDKAILAAVVSALRTADPLVRPVIASLEPIYTRLTVEQMPELRGCEVIPVAAALDRVRSSRAVVFGGGPLMAIREIADLEALFARARAMRLPRIVAGCGVGPLGAEAYNRSIRGLLANASHRIFRDEQSRQLAADRLGIDVHFDEVAEDPAAAWLRSTRVAPPVAPGAPLLALGLRDWPYEQYAPTLSDAAGARIKAKFENEVAAGLVALCREYPDLRLLPVPFCTNFAGGDDRWFYRRMLRKSPSLRAISDTSLLSKERAPAEYATLLRSASAMLTMRFHSLVFASKFRIPSVAIDYTGGQGKTFSLASRLGSPMLTVECLQADQLVAELCRALSSSCEGPVIEPDFSAAFARVWRAAERAVAAPSP